LNPLCYASENYEAENGSLERLELTSTAERDLRSVKNPSKKPKNGNQREYIVTFDENLGEKETEKQKDTTRLSPRFRYITETEKKVQNSNQENSAGYKNQARFIEDLSDYDIVDANDDDLEGEYTNDDDNEGNRRRYRGGGKGGKGGKGGRRRGQEEEEDPLKKYVPPFWLGKPQPGWGHGGVQQVGYILNKDLGGWSVWPSGWTSASGLDTGGLKYVDGEGWVGSVGAPWTVKKHTWGPGWQKPEEMG